MNRCLVLLLRLTAITASLLLISACSSLEPAPATDPSLKAVVHAVTVDAELITFKASQPDRLIQRKMLSGMAPGETLVGIDYSVARGELYAMSNQGRLYRLDPSTGKLAGLKQGKLLAVPPGGVGFDFNPAADRIRFVAADGTNLRFHPDTGALAATDPKLQYAATDPAHGQAPRLGGAAYTYNKRDEKITTNYAIDLARGTLVTQGSAEGVSPAISPNTGTLFTVGPLGTGPIDDVAFDIADVDNTALAAIPRGGRTGLYVIELRSGHARNVGTIGQGRPRWGMAFEP